MMSIFPNMADDIIEVFIDDFFIIGDSFEDFLNHMSNALIRCKD